MSFTLYKKYLNRCSLNESCNVHNFSKENEDKFLFSYNKNKPSFLLGYDENKQSLDEYIKLHRSLIVLNDKLVCFSPPKSLSFANFCEKYPTISDDIVIEEFIEGTMINVFYNNVSNSWEIATKSNIGGTNGFYKYNNCTYSFKDLFYDACQYIGFDLNTGLNPKYCYSFVMRHPFNPMIKIVSVPSLYLIDVYEIDNDYDDSVITIHVKNRDEIWKQLTLNWDIKKPRQVQFDKYKDINFINLLQTDDWCYIRQCVLMGYVVKNKRTNERTKVRNEEYEYLHKLRGNESYFLYQYLILRQNGRMRDYLKYFPESCQSFNYYRDLLHSFTEKLYLCYVSVHITKTQQLSYAPRCYRRNVFEIHREYLSKKTHDPSSKFKITRKFVIDYVNGLDRRTLLGCLNLYNAYFS